MHKWYLKKKYWWTKIYWCKHCNSEKIVYLNEIIYSKINEVILSKNEPQCTNNQKEKERLDMI